MKRTTFAVVALLSCAAACTGDSPKRPRILSIAYVKILVSNAEKARDFYSLALNAVPPPADPGTPRDWKEHAPLSVRLGRKRLGPFELEALQSADSPNLLHEVAFSTDDVRKLRGFLQKNHFTPGNLTKCGENPCFSILDPENHHIVFVQLASNRSIGITGAYSQVSQKSPIIHAGFVVHDREAEDRFYREILGFHVYWHGGRKDDQTDWVDMQVPDGTDWIEYMLNVPPDADHRRLGVMNHIALGVPDIHAAEKQLRAHGWNGTEQPKIGRDGKWQLNLYDPDDTRVELMEFAPVQKPCCSEYTGPHPGSGSHQ
jgi:catechol 2,3-dioxygenase-like lactoylglutathione lyase family enzyme